MSDADLGERIALLRNSDLFAELDSNTLRTLASRAYLRSYQANDLIFREGSEGDSMMVVAQGVVRIVVMAPTAREIILTEYKQGEVFGEIALLDGQSRTADARSQTNCKLLILERRDLLGVMNSTPTLAVSLLEMLCARLRRSNDRMMELAFLQLAPRLARTMLEISAGDTEGRSRKPKRLTMPQSDLANMVGSSRENVNRCLRRWQIDGLIDLNENGIVLLDQKGLARAAETP